MENTTSTSIAQKIIDGLHKGIAEIEELQLQAALGKAEAKDLYEKAKKNFNDFIQQARHSFSTSAGNLQTDALRIKGLLEQLQAQLNLGKAETIDAFEEQKNNLIRFLHELEGTIKSNKGASALHSELAMEIEKFKLKLEILKLIYELKKIHIKEEFEEKKKIFQEKISKIKDKLLSTTGPDQEKWQTFRDEMSEAYQHFKKAFV